MCGILGQISNKEINTEKFISALNTMIHRGPDSYGIWKNEMHNIFFGHRRLSVIDLNENAGQPMKSEDGKLIITYNGEIYNFKKLREELIKKGHRFLTHGDTEVILHAWKEWGIKSLEYLQGMFAFAIYDVTQQKIFAARDRAGEKPFYYSLKNQTFSFASELKALIKLYNESPQINHASMNCLLGMGYVPGNRSIFNDYHKLLPGHYIEYDLKKETATSEAYWKLPFFEKTTSSTNQLMNDLDSMLLNSVSGQLQADVKTGILLSGGLDSSLITSYASHLKSDIHTYTVTFPGYKNNEAVYAKMISDYFGTTHTEIETDKAEPELLFLLAKQFDEPIADTSILPSYLLSTAVKKHCTVALGGDGGDELFGGYDRYQQWNKMQQLFGKFPKIARTAFSETINLILPIGYKGKYYLQQIGADFKNSIPLVDSFMNLKERKTLTKGRLTPCSTELIKIDLMDGGLNLSDRAMRADYHSYMTDDILVKSDRSSMLASLETRAPFLDKNIIEFAFSKVPTNLKVNTSEKKILLKMLAKQKLPTNFDFQRKQGFVPPMEHWLKEKKWEIFLKENLFNTKDSWWNTKFIEHLWLGQQKGRFNKRRLFLILMIELWRKEYSAQL